MTLLHLCSLFIAAVSAYVPETCWPSEMYTQPAVGLDFGASHGRAVLKWANGTVQEIAEIQGGPAYTSAMLESLECHKDYRNVTSSDQCRLGNAVWADTKPACAGLALSSFRPFKTMALALKHRVEVSLSHPISMLGVTYPLFLDSQQQATLRDAVRSAGFNASLSYSHDSSAFAAAAAANGIKLCKCPMFRHACFEEYINYAEMVLYIDYSERALTVFLYEARNPELWQDGGMAYFRSAPPGNGTAPAGFWDEVADVLRHMASEALDHTIDYVVLAGTRTHEAELQQAIRCGLGVGYESWEQAMAESRAVGTLYTGAVDPVLAAAQGIADLSWRRNTRRWWPDYCRGWTQVPGCASETNWGGRPTLMQLRTGGQDLWAYFEGLAETGL